MKKLVTVGLFFVCFSLVYPLVLQQTVYQTDVIPTFLGFLLITLGLDEMPYENRKLRELKGLMTGCSVVSFVLTVGQLFPLYRFFIFSATGETNELFVRILSLLRTFYTTFENAIVGVCMITVAFFCYAIGTELKKRIPSADDSFTGHRKNAYGDERYSQAYIRSVSRFSAVFTVVYAVVAAGYFFNQIYAFVRNANVGELKGFYLPFYDFEFGLWAFLIPVHFAFMFFANAAVNICHQPRPGGLNTCK